MKPIETSNQYPLGYVIDNGSLSMMDIKTDRTPIISPAADTNGSVNNTNSSNDHILLMHNCINNYPNPIEPSNSQL